MKDKLKAKKTAKKWLSILKLLVLLIVVVGIPVYIYFKYPDFFEQFQSMESVNAFLEQYHAESFFVYYGLQIIQILLPVIPGQFIQFAGGYLYSFWPAYLVAIAGAATGTTLSFCLARLLGKDAIHLIFGEERINRFVEKLNSKKAFVIILVLFLFPGFPKDFVSYAAGISEIKLKSFLMVSLIGRTPAMMGTIMMGSMLRTGSYVGLIILGVITVILFIWCIWKRNVFLEYVDRLYEKFVK